MTPEERAEYERRMRLPPVNIRDLPVPIPDTGNPIAVPDPVMEVGEPTVTRRVPQPRPVEPIEDAELAGLVERLSGVADKAQAGMSPSRVAVQMGEPTEISRVESPSGPRPGGIPAQVAQFVMSAAGRRPLVSSGGDGGQVSPVTDTPKPPSDDEKLQKALEFAKRRQGLGNVGAALTEQLAIANGRDASGTVNRMRADAAAPVSDAQSKLEQAKAFAAKRLGMDRDFAQQMTAQERADRLEKRGAEAQEYERTRQGEMDSLGKRKTEAEIAKLNAEAARARRPAAPSPVQTFREEAAIEKDIHALGKSLEGMPAIQNDLNTLVEYADRKDIPGVAKGYQWVPDFMEPLITDDEGKKVRQSARGVVGAYLKMRSGTAASDAEVARLMSELGMGPNATEEEFKTGLKRAIGNFKDEVRLKKAGVRPQAVDEAKRRGMRMDEAFPDYDPEMPKPVPGPKSLDEPTVRAEDDAAIKWARNNPDDPRAKRILSLHGVQ
jgi:hypothetical protein